MPACRASQLRKSRGPCACWWWWTVSRPIQANLASKKWSSQKSMRSGSQSRIEWGLAVLTWDSLEMTCCLPRLSSLWKDGTGRFAPLPWWGQHLSWEKCFRPAVFSRINASKFNFMRQESFFWIVFTATFCHCTGHTRLSENAAASVGKKCWISLWPLCLPTSPWCMEHIYRVALKNKRTSCNWASTLFNFISQLFGSTSHDMSVDMWVKLLIWLHLRTFSTVHCNKVKSDLTEVVMMNRGLKSFECFQCSGKIMATTRKSPCIGHKI